MSMSASPAQTRKVRRQVTVSTQAGRRQKSATARHSQTKA